MNCYQRQLRALRSGRARVRDEQGFALLMTLAIIGLLGLVVVALLGLTMTSTALSSTQLRAAKEGRAADGAMDAAVNQMLRDTTGRLGGLDTVCDPVRTMTIDDVDVRVECEPEVSDQPPVPTNERTNDVVRVVGTSYRGDPLAPDSAARNWRQLPATCLMGAACFPWVEALSPRPTADWQTGSPARLAGEEATVLHTAGEPLWVIGDMAVREGAAPLRNPSDRPTGNYDQRAPALGTSGVYAQGDPGMFAGVTGNHLGIPAEESGRIECGILTEEKPEDDATAWNVPGAQIRAVEGLYCDDDTASADRPDPAAGLSPAHPSLPAAPANWSPAAVVSNARTVPASCPTTRVVTFTPGSYNRTETARMNQWFARGNCDNKVFWFPPGDYWFDVDDTSLPAPQAAWRNELRINDSTSLFVFGTPNASGGNPDGVTSASSPMCNRTQPGVSVSLSSRTSIRHTSGRVAVCAGNTRQVAIYQEKAVNLGWESTPTTVVGGSQFQCINSIGFLNICAAYQWIVGTAINWVLGLFGGGITWAPGTQISSVPTGDNLLVPCQTLNIISKCANESIIGLSGFSGRGDTIGSPIDSATVLIESNSVNANGDRSQTRIDVVPTGGSNVMCSVTYPRLNDRFFVGSYELITTDPGLRTPGVPMCGDIGPGGRPLLNDRLQLTDAKIAIRLVSESTSVVGVRFGPQVNSVRLRASWGPSFAGGVAYGGNAQQGGGTIGRVHVRCFWEWRNTSWWPYIPYPVPVCPQNGDGTFTISNLGVNDTFVSSATNPKLTSLGVVVGGSTYGPLGVFQGRAFEYLFGFRQSSTISVSVLNPNGSVVCTNTYPSSAAHEGGLPNEWNGKESRYLSLLEFERVEAGQTHYGRGSGNCPTALRTWTAADLQGKNIQVRVQFYNEGAPGCLAGLGLINCDYGFNLDRLKVTSTVGDCLSTRAGCPTTVANAYQGPTTPFRATSNNQAVISGQPNTAEAAFHTYGNVSIPRADLELRWTGPPAVDPFVTGSMWVNAISSEAKVDGRPGAQPPRVGILCCVPGRPSERVVTLRAFVGDQLRGFARVRISDTKVALDATDGTWSPGFGVRTEAWQLCQNDADPDPGICFRT